VSRPCSRAQRPTRWWKSSRHSTRPRRSRTPGSTEERGSIFYFLLGRRKNSWIVSDRLADTLPKKSPHRPLLSFHDQGRLRALPITERRARARVLSRPHLGVASRVRTRGWCCGAEGAAQTDLVAKKITTSRLTGVDTISHLVLASCRACRAVTGASRAPRFRTCFFSC